MKSIKSRIVCNLSCRGDGGTRKDCAKLLQVPVCATRQRLVWKRSKRNYCMSLFEAGLDAAAC